MENKAILFSVIPLWYRYSVTYALQLPNEYHIDHLGFLKDRQNYGGSNINISHASIISATDTFSAIKMLVYILSKKDNAGFKGIN